MDSAAFTPSLTRHRLGGLTKDAREELFRALCNELSCSTRIGDAIVDGLGFRQVGKLIDLAGRLTKSGINRVVAFKSESSPYLPTYWKALGNHLSASPRNTVIMGISGRHDHWTVVRRVNSCRVELADSDGIHYFRKNGCAETDEDERKICPWPTQTYLIRPQERSQ